MRVDSKELLKANSTHGHDSLGQILATLDQASTSAKEMSPETFRSVVQLISQTSSNLKDMDLRFI